MCVAPPQYFSPSCMRGGSSRLVPCVVPLPHTSPSLYRPPVLCSASPFTFPHVLCVPPPRTFSPSYVYGPVTLLSVRSVCVSVVAHLGLDQSAPRFVFGPTDHLQPRLVRDPAAHLPPSPRSVHGPAEHTARSICKRTVDHFYFPKVCAISSIALRTRPRRAHAPLFRARPRRTRSGPFRVQPRCCAHLLPWSTRHLLPRTPCTAPSRTSRLVVFATSLLPNPALLHCLDISYVVICYDIGYDITICHAIFVARYTKCNYSVAIYRMI